MNTGDAERNPQIYRSDGVSFYYRAPRGSDLIGDFQPNNGDILYVYEAGYFVNTVAVSARAPSALQPFTPPVPSELALVWSSL